jgi:hypothetical protein
MKRSSSRSNKGLAASKFEPGTAANTATPPRITKVTPKASPAAHQARARHNRELETVLFTKSSSISSTKGPDWSKLGTSTPTKAAAGNDWSTPSRQEAGRR